MPFVLGLNHRSAPLEVRERLAVGSTRLSEFLESLKSSGPVDGIVALSTCNRTEIYVQTHNRLAAREAIVSRLKQQSQFSDLDPCLYYRESEDCVQHLFRVASGLDSMVQGENEILGQVKQAYLAAQQSGFTGKLLNVLFQRSLYVGKRVRTETALSVGAGSVGSVAVSVAQRIFSDLHEHTVMILGAGDMAEITAKHLLSQKVRSLIVANRTFERACELAAQIGGTAMHFDEGLREMAVADIVICSTASPRPILHADHVRSIMSQRKGRSLFIIDIAMPRDVDPEVNRIDNVYLFNLDDMQKIVDENQSRRAGEIVKAEHIVKHETHEFSHWLRNHRAGIQQGLHHRPYSPSPFPLPGERVAKPGEGL
jgi:glutamyl-tRNA reductase